ncbi:uncharacterized protein LOC134207373 [Armigeres subalbatus]|uniref:uncharacterized protein LOC134207373 n=1 Tax=Armigeres subalbatus TaxID=124917 RepID=UPI002ED33D3B
MLIKCCIEDCGIQFDAADKLLTHLAVDHRTPTNYRYPCSYPKCFQVFSKLYNFKRHLKNHVFPQNDTKTVPSNEDISITPLVESEPMKKVQKKEFREPDKEPGTNITDKLNIIHKSATEFTLSLHNKKNFSRQDVQYVQQETQKFCSSIANQIESLDVNTNNPEIQHQLTACISSMKTAFNFIGSDYKLFEHLNRIGLFKYPSVITLTNDNCIISEDFQIENYDRKSCLVLNDVEFQIKSFFEQHSILTEMIDNVKKLENSNSINHFINGKVWQTIKQKYAHDKDFNYVIPVWLYADEFEINDTQSSHHKVDSICGIYYNFPTLPEKYSSKICNIFVAGFIRKVVMNKIGINKLVEQLVKTFKKIEEEGVLILHQGVHIKVRFVLTMVQGDNLGIHTLLLLSGSFNATFYCRFCRRSKQELQKDCKEHEEFLRNVQNYTNDLRTMDKSHGLQNEEQRVTTIVVKDYRGSDPKNSSKDYTV